MSLAGCGKHAGTIYFYSSGNRFETFYDDSYFYLDNKVYSQEIALASQASATASINANKDYSKKCEYLVDLWQKEGFSSIYINDGFKEKPTLDSIGFGIAHKRIGDFNLITVTIRSGEYESEWASNFTVGNSGNAAGFNNSAIIVANELNSYINSGNFAGHTKFWLNGYSRGGAVTNLVAASILDSINDGTFNSSIITTKDDIYAYCFEPPNPALISIETAKSDLYKGIHNLINFNDLVTMVLPSEWGMHRYGQSHFYPDRLTDINFDAKERKKMVSNYHFMEGAQYFADYAVDDWKFYDAGKEATEAQNLPRESLHPSLGRFAHNLIKTLTGFTVTREMFSGYENGVRNIVAAVNGYNPDIEGIEISKSVFMDILFSYSLIQTLFSELQEKDYGGFANDVEYVFYAMFNVNKENIDAIQQLYNDVYYLILFTVPAFDKRADLMHQLFSRDNLLILTSTHYPELNYSFLSSADTRLYGNDAVHLNDGTYQILHIKTPSYINIYERTLNKTVFSYSNGQMVSDTLSAEKLADGSIDIYMPKNGQYAYHIESDDISLINVDEYNNETLLQENMPKRGSF